MSKVSKKHGDILAGMAAAAAHNLSPEMFEPPEGTEPEYKRPENAKKPLFYESITKAVSPSGATIRVWNGCETMSEFADTLVLEAIHTIPKGSLEMVIDHLSSCLPDIAAVELTDKNGMGSVTYFSWCDKCGDENNEKTNEKTN